MWWLLFQSLVIFAVVASNIHWRWQEALGEDEEPAASGDEPGDGDVWVMTADTRLPLWSSRPNLFQLVADLRGIAPICRAVAGRPRFTHTPQTPGPFLERSRHEQTRK